MRHFYVIFILLIASISVQAQLTISQGLNLPGYWDTITKPIPPTRAALRMANPPGTAILSDAPFCSIPYTGGTIDLYNNLYSGHPLNSSMYRINPNDNLTPGTYDGSLSQGFYFTSGPCGMYDSLKWGGTSVIMNSLQNFSLASASENSITLNPGKHYTINFDNPSGVGTNATNSAIFFETSTRPADINSVNYSYDACNGADGMIVTVYLDTQAAPEQNVFVRYSSNAFSSSTYIPLIFMDTANPNKGKAIIPYSAGTAIQFYVLSTTLSRASMQSTYSSGATIADIVTLTAATNGGLYYNDTFPLTASPFTLNGHYLVDNTASSFFPASYYFSSLTDAITAINTYGVCGDVVINVPGGYTVTAPIGGYTIDLSAMADSLKPADTQRITIKKQSSTGALPLITAAAGTITPTALSTTVDGIFSLIGTDYICLDRLAFNDPNAANPARMEFGLGLFKSSASDGCQNVRVSKCFFDLSKFNTAGPGQGVNNLWDRGSHAIHASNSTRTAMNAHLSISSVSGRNDNDTISGCTFQDCYTGLYWCGYNDPSVGTPFVDQNLCIGGSSAEEGNKFQNFGGATINANYAALIVRNVNDLFISRNTFDNDAAGGVSAGTTTGNVLRAILVSSDVLSTPSDITIKKNTISGMVNGAASAGYELIAVSGFTGVVGTFDNIITINENTISSNSYTAPGNTSNFYGIRLTAGSPVTVNVKENAIKSHSFPVANDFRAISNEMLASSVSISADTILSNNTAGNFYPIFNSAAVTTFKAQNNVIGLTGLGNTHSSTTTNCYFIFNNANTITNTISGNIIVGNSRSVSGSGAFYGYYYTGTGAGGSSSINNNVFRNNSSLSTAATLSMAFAYTSAASSAHSYTFSNDSVIGITNNAAGIMSVIRIANASTLNINNCYVDGFTQNNSAAAASHSCFELTAGSNFICKDNYINNFGLTAIGSATSPSLRAILTAATAFNTIQNNTISNLNVYGTTSPVLQAIRKQTAAGSLDSIGGNRILGLNQNSISTGAAEVCGISYATGSGPYILKNSIANLLNNGQNSSAAVYGLSVLAGTGPFRIINNFIQGLNSPNASGNLAISGLHLLQTAQTYLVYYNSIVLGNGTPISSVGSDFGASCIYYPNAGTGSLDCRNNIMSINGSPSGTGLLVCLRRAGGTANTVAANFNALSNYNLFYAAASANCWYYAEGANAGTIVNGYTGYASFTDIPASNLQKDLDFNNSCGKYKIFMFPRDMYSFNEDLSPLFAGGSLYPENLMLNSGTTFAESGGQSISVPNVTTDFFGNVRNVSTPDVGAHEFSGISAGDYVPPSVSFSNIPNQACATGPTLLATITDASGIKIASGSRPRVWYKKSTESNVMPATNTSADNGWKWVEATNTSSPFSFTLDYSILSSPVAAGNTIQYFVAASDSSLTPNLAVHLAAFTNGCPSDVALSGAIFPVLSIPVVKSYNVLNVYSGTLQMSDPADWGGTALSSLTVASGLFDKLNLGYVQGDLIVEVDTNFVSETGIITLKELTSATCVSSTPTLTIVPKNAVQRTISGNFSGSTSLITINAADNITIDGRFGGSGQYLKFDQVHTSNTGNTILIRSNGALVPTPVTSSSNNITIRNCVISGSNYNGGNTVCGIYVGGATTASTGDNDQITLDGNSITDAHYGINVNGVSTANPVSGLDVRNNLIGQTGSYTIRIGITIQNANTPSVTGNVLEFIGGSTGNAFAINMQTGNRGNVTVSNNVVNTLSSTNSDVYGIFLQATLLAGSDQFIAEGNSVEGLGNTGATSSSLVGIFLSGNSLNSVVSGNTVQNFQSAGSSSGATYGIWASGINTNLQLTNNEISDLTSAGTSGANSFGIVISNPCVGALIDNNEIYDLDYNGSGAFSGKGIYLSNASTGIVISNNRIYDIRGQGADMASINYIDAIAGIMVSTNVTGTQIYHNSVNLYSTNTTSIANTKSACMMTTGVSINTLDLRNNIFRNFTDLGGVTTDNAYAVFAKDPATNVYSVIDHNNYYVGTPAGGTKYLGGSFISPALNLFFPDLSAWKVMSGQDWNSLERDPYFVSNTDLHTQNCTLRNRGEQGLGVSTDMDNQIRDTLPDIGADEFTAPAIWALSGTKQMSDASDWGGTALTSFTNANGLFDHLNQRYLSGDLIVQVDADFAAESGIYPLIEMDSSGCLDTINEYSIRIEPIAAVTHTISGSFTNTNSKASLIKLRSADNITFDGSFAGGGRYLNFKQNNTSNQGAIFHIMMDSTSRFRRNADCNKIDILNCGIEGAGPSLYKGSGIFVGDTNAVSISGAHAFNNDSMSFRGNSFKNLAQGIYVTAKSTSLNNGIDALLIEDNVVGDTSSNLNSLGLKGVYVQNAISPSIRNNRIANLNGNGTMQGLYCAAKGITAVQSNNISGFNSSGGTTVYGIQLEAISGQTVQFNCDSNSIADMNSNAAAIYGIHQSGSNGSTNYNSLSDMHITAGSSSATAVYLPEDDLYSVNGNDINDLSATGNEVNGIYLINTAAGNTVDMNNNRITNLLSSNNAAYAIRINHNNNVNSSVSNNYIAAVNAQTSAYGIYSGNKLESHVFDRDSISRVNAVNGNAYGIYHQGTVNDGVYSFNHIQKIGNSNSAVQKGGKGILIYGTTAADNNLLHNNTVSGMYGAGALSTNPADMNAGIALRSSTNSSIYYNSINLVGSSAISSPAAVLSASLFLSAPLNGLQLNNNIFRNRFDVSGTATDIAAAVYMQDTTSSFASMDYNDYDVASSGIGKVAAIKTGAVLRTYSSLLSNWLPVSIGDSNSLQADPLFVSDSNLHIGSCQLNRRALVIPALTIDMDGDSRDATLPDIGADEYLLSMPSLSTNIIQTPSTSLNAQYECITDDGWAHLYNQGLDLLTETSDDKLLLSLNRNGNDIGYVSEGLLANVTTTANYGNNGHIILAPAAPYVTNPEQEWEVMARWWNVIPLQQPSTDVSLRFYYDDTDFQDVNDRLVLRGFAALATHPELQVYKMLDTANADPLTAHIGLDSTEVVLYDHSLPADPGPNWVYSPVSASVHQAQFDVSSFSGGGMGGFPGGPLLPVEWLEIAAKAVQNSFIQLSWSTASEIDNTGFDILRSEDGISFTNIGWMPAGLNPHAVQNYSFNDYAVQPNRRYYYKLIQRDLNGLSEESKVVSAIIFNADQVELNLFPNPADKQAVISLNWPLEQSIRMQVFNILGELQWQELRILPEGKSVLNLEIADWPAGLYRIRLESETESYTLNLNVLH